MRPTPPLAAQTTLQDRLAALWLHSLPLVRERVAKLEQAAEHGALTSEEHSALTSEEHSALTSEEHGALTSEEHSALIREEHADLHRDAIAAAHNLAGSLGMFGYPEGTALARAIEQMLQAGHADADRLKRLTHELRLALRL